LEDYGTNAAEGMLCETSRNLSHQDFWLHHERNVSIHVWQRWSWFGKGIWQVLVEGNDIQLSCVIETAIAVLTNTQVWCKCCVLLCLLFLLLVIMLIVCIQRLICIHSAGMMVNSACAHNQHSTEINKYYISIVCLFASCNYVQQHSSTCSFQREW
jgi:hypothetical protein